MFSKRPNYRDGEQICSCQQLGIGQRWVEGEGYTAVHMTKMIRDHNDEKIFTATVVVFTEMYACDKIAKKNGVV